ncbi:MAG: LamG-like jellyroll fold domain-containing protein [Ginsengibacter sp.]
MKNFTKLLKPVFLLFFAGLFTLSVNAQNNALNFDGVDDYVDIPYPSTWPAVRTVQISANVTDANGGGYQTIFAAGGKALNGNYQGFGLFVYNGNWTILLGNGGTSYISLVGPAVNYGVWTTVTGSYDGTKFRLYINGLPADSLVSTLLPNPSLPIRLGASNAESTPPQNYFKGQLDELRIWSKVLDSTQVSNGWKKNSLTGTEGNLLYYYNFNNGVGNGDNTGVVTPPKVDFLTAQTGGNNGTLHNFTLNGLTSNWVTSALALPINLATFEGAKKGGSNYLQWSTESEQNSSYFGIQRSTDGVNFTDIARVDAAGNSDNTRNYSYSDNQLSSFSSVYYYKLKMVDMDGKFKYSSVLPIKNVAVSLAKIFPNPANNQFTITVNDNSLLNTKVTLNDLNGKVLQRISITQSSTPVNISNYVRGVYVLKFENGSSIKVVKE